MTVPFDQPEYDRWFRTAGKTLSEDEAFAAQGRYHWAAREGKVVLNESYWKELQ